MSGWGVSAAVSRCPRYVRLCPKSGDKDGVIGRQLVDS